MSYVVLYKKPELHILCLTGFLLFIAPLSDGYLHMEENRQEQDLTKAEENKTADRKTRHTWIGDADEIRPDYSEEQTSRATYQEILERGTRLMEKRERKAYTGFITDEELKTAEAAAEIDRRAREENRAARQTIRQTRIYRGFDSSVDEEDGQPAEEPEVKAPEKKQKRRREYKVRVIEAGKFKRFAAVLLVFALLILFELSFVVMKFETKALPGRTQGLRGKIATQQANNAEMQKKTGELGDYNDLKNLRDSWQTTRDKLAE